MLKFAHESRKQVLELSEILNRIIALLSGIKLGGRKSRRELMAFDDGVLKIAVMVAAIDGEILPGERGPGRFVAPPLSHDAGRARQWRAGRVFAGEGPCLAEGVPRGPVLLEPASLLERAADCQLAEVRGPEPRPRQAEEGRSPLLQAQRLHVAERSRRGVLAASESEES